MQFDGQVAWVVGGSSGIGLEVSIQLAERGAQAVVMGRDPLKLDMAFERLAGAAIVCPVDATESWPSLTKYPQPDLLVTCQAAPVLSKPAMGITRDEWDCVIDTDLTGTFNMVQIALHHMVDQRFGRIVCMSSIHAHKSTPNRAAYAAAKAGVEGFVRAVATEVGEYGITINAVAPGYTATERTLSAVQQSASAQMAISRTPTGRMADVAEVADAVLFLLGNGAINGAVINVDGGLSVAL